MAHIYYRTKAIVLKKEDRGEADQVFTCFCEDFGRIEVNGKAIRKITSKLKSGIDIFYLTEIEFIQGKAQKTLTDAVAIDKFKNFQQNLSILEVVSLIADAVNTFITKEEPDQQLWNLLLTTFNSFENLSIDNCLSAEARMAKAGKLKIIYYAFLWKLFALLGYSPELYQCVLCRQKLMPETFHFSVQEGGIVCWRCLKKITEQGKPFLKEAKVNVVKLIRFFLSEPIEATDKLLVEESDLKNLKIVSELYLDFLKESVK